MGGIERYTAGVPKRPRETVAAFLNGCGRGAAGSSVPKRLQASVPKRLRAGMQRLRAGAARGWERS